MGVMRILWCGAGRKLFAHVGVRPAQGGDVGSILLLLLLACLAIAVVVHTAVTVVVCAERALTDESVGRSRMAEKDAGLSALRESALAAWEETSWMTVGEGPHPVEGALGSVVEDPDLLLGATVRHADSASRVVVSAWVERGRDGVDLPVAALVAASITADSARDTPWMEAGSEGGDGAGGDDPDPAPVALAYACEPPAVPLLGPGCSLVKIGAPWRLDPGWRSFAEAASREGVAPGENVALLAGRPGWTERFPEGSGGRSAADPMLVVLTGGAHLDATDLGELYGVLVVDAGSVQLEGTAVHGAVFATGAVVLGSTGRVVYSQPILRWATDRSLVRTRLVPGSRRESTE